jgi:hypothetical protein
MSAGNALKPMPMLIIDTSTLNNLTYTEVTPSGGFTHAIALIHAISNSTRDVIVSYNGTTAHDIIASNSQVNFVPQASATPNNNVALLPKGTKLFFKTSGALAGGLLYLATYYQN